MRVQTAPRLALRLQAPRLDRIVRGRAWIPVLGVLLVAIVGLRVEVLKLGAGVGSDVQQATALQSSNAALRSQISALSDNGRIARLAAVWGYHMPNALDPHFLQASAGRHVGAAIRNIGAPAPQTYLTDLAAEEHTDQVSSQAGGTLSAVGAPPTSSTPSSSGTTPSTSLNTTSQVSTATQSASTGGYTNTSALSTSGSTTYGSSSPGSTAPSSSTPSTATSSSTAVTSGTGSAGLGTDSTGATSGSPPSTASANGAAGLAG